MKITCLQENLKKGLNITQNIVGKNLTLPILNNLLLETDNGRLKVSSTNLEIGINTWISGKIEKNGALTCPAKVLAGLVNSLPNKKIEIEVKSNTLYLKCEDYKTSIKGLGADDFPLIPKIKEKPTLVFKKSEILKNGLSQVVGSVAPSESRPEISGVLFKIGKDTVKLVATDSFRLAEKTLHQAANINQPLSLIIPQRTIQELIRILTEKPEGEVRLVIGDNQVLFELDEIQLISRVIDGQYPDYEQIIPTKFETRLTLAKEEFLNNIRIASIFSSKINDVRLSIKSGKLEIMAQDPDLGENRSLMAVQMQGGGIEISFNFRYLIDGLGNIYTKQVFLGLNHEINAQASRSNPAVLKPVGEEGFLYIIMPIKTS